MATKKKQAKKAGRKAKGQSGKRTRTGPPKKKAKKK